MASPWDNFTGSYQGGLSPELLAAYRAYAANPASMYGQRSGNSPVMTSPDGQWAMFSQAAPQNSAGGHHDSDGNWIPNDPGQQLTMHRVGTNTGAGFDPTGKYLGLWDSNKNIETADLMGIAMMAAPFAAAIGGIGAAAAGGAGASAGGAGVTGLSSGAALDAMYGGAALGGGASLGGGAAAGTAAMGAGATSTGAGGLFNSITSALGGGGSMGWESLVGPAMNAAGSMMSASAAKGAANTSAEAQLNAARIAAESAKFRPVGITNRFGSSAFQTDANGNVIGAGYGVSPELAALRDKMLIGADNFGYNLGNKAAYAGGNMFDLGQGYVATTPEQAAQSWMGAQQNLLAPTRERQLAGVRNGLFNSGRSGLAVGATGARPDGSEGLRASNPEMEAYYNALAQQDAQLATQAMEQGRQQTLFGSDLMSKGVNMTTNAYAPVQSWLGLSDSIDALGRNTLQMGAELGGRSATAGANAGQFLMQGGMGAAQTMQAANAYSPMGSFFSGLASNPSVGNTVGNWMSGWGRTPSYVNTGTATGFDMDQYYA